MTMVEYLRREVRRLRGYSATQRQRKRLYLWLKSRDGWRNPSVRVKLGASNMEWLEGLVAYGDERGWSKEDECCGNAGAKRGGTKRD